MKVGDLVRCLIEFDYGIVTETPVDNDGWYRVRFVNGQEDFVEVDDVEVVNESR